MYKWPRPVPRVPLADAVAAFNASNYDNPVGQHEPRMNEREIVAAVQSQLPTLPADIAPLFAEAVRTRSLPPDSRIYAIGSWSRKNGDHYTVWWINLDLNTAEKSGYARRIRENNDPAAKPKREAKLSQPSFNWIP